jgi:glycosyltransferase involved in cell wall biosynthesis
MVGTGLEGGADSRLFRASCPTGRCAFASDMEAAQPIERLMPDLVSVVIPVYNEENLLEAAVSQLTSDLASLGAPCEVILAENGSRDQTLAIANRLSTTFPQVRVLHVDHPNYGLALRRGIEQAAGTYCVCDEIDICDVGFHRRALDILRRDEADMVVGSKRHPGAADRRPLHRRLATRVINLLLRVAVGFTGTDTHGLKAFRRASLLPIVARCIVDKDLFASELVIRAERAGLRVTEIPFSVVEKRATPISVFRRVPSALRNLWRLFLVIRLGRPA